MAAIFKRNDRDGKPAKKWSYKFKNDRGKWVTKAGHRLKEKTERMAEADEDKARRIRNGEMAPVSASLLDDLIKDFEKHLEASDNTTKHVTLTVGRVKRIFNSCEFATLADLRSPAAMDRFNNFITTFTFSHGKKGSKRKASQTTLNHYRAAVKIFCHWAVTTRKMPDCVLLTLKISTVTDGRKRRAATEAELAKLLASTDKAEPSFDFTGSERAALYRVAVNTGFRVNELASLTPASFHFDAKAPYVYLAASNAKNRREARQPIHPSLVGPFKAFLRGLPINELIWPGTWVNKAASMIRVDLAAADVAEMDFHSLRTSYITNLARIGVHPKKAQQLARHSDINLTMKFYTNFETEELAAVVPAI